MTYEVIKYIKGNPYRYLVKSVREGDRVRQVFVRYLGRADQPSREYLETEPASEVTTPRIGLAPEEIAEREARPRIDEFAARFRGELSKEWGITPTEVAPAVEAETPALAKPILEVTKEPMIISTPETAKDYIIKKEPEPLLPSGFKYMVYQSDGTPMYISGATSEEAESKLKQGHEVASIKLEGKTEVAPITPINPYMNMPIERVRRDATHGVKLAKEALAVREAATPEIAPAIPEVTPKLDFDTIKAEIEQGKQVTSQELDFYKQQVDERQRIARQAKANEQIKAEIEKKLQTSQYIDPDILRRYRAGEFGEIVEPTELQKTPAPPTKEIPKIPLEIKRDETRNTIDVMFSPRTDVQVNLRTRQSLDTHEAEFDPSRLDLDKEAALIKETIDTVDDALESANMRRAIKQAFDVEWQRGLRPTSKAYVGIIVTNDQKDAGMGSAGTGSAKVFWSPYSDKELYNQSLRQYSEMGVDGISTLAHEYHHALGGSGELDDFSEAVAANIHLKHNLELIRPDVMKQWVWSKTNSVLRHPKSKYGIMARESLGFAREGNPELFDKLLNETGYPPEQVSKVRNWVNVTTKKWKALSEGKPLPPEVVKEYPELKPTPTPTVETKSEEVVPITPEIKTAKDYGIEGRNITEDTRVVKLKDGTLAVDTPMSYTYFTPEGERIPLDKISRTQIDETVQVYTELEKPVVETTTPEITTTNVFEKDFIERSGQPEFYTPETKIRAKPFTQLISTQYDAGQKMNVRNVHIGKVKGEEAWADGFMLEIKPVPEKLKSVKGYKEMAKDVEGKPRDFSSLVPDYSIDGIEVKPILKTDLEAIKGQATFLASEDKSQAISIDTKYVDYFLANYPDAKFITKKGSISSPINVQSKGKTVGTVMPIFKEKSEYDIFLRYISGGEAVAQTVKVEEPAPESIKEVRKPVKVNPEMADEVLEGYRDLDEAREALSEFANREVVGYTARGDEVTPDMLRQAIEIKTTPKIETPEVKPITLTLYHGQRVGGTDAGDFGKGRYLTGDYERAKAYGQVSQETITLQNPRIFNTYTEAMDYRRSIVGEELVYKPQSEEASRMVEEALRKEGYDGVVVYDKEAKYTAYPDKPFEVVKFAESPKEPATTETRPAPNTNALLAHLREAPQSKSTENYLRKTFGDETVDKAYQDRLVTRTPKGIYTITLSGRESIKDIPSGKVNLYAEGKRILAEAITLKPETETATFEQNITKAVEERPSRISHGYTAKNAFYITKDNRIIPADEFSQVSRGDNIISVHSHSGENWEQYTKEHGQESFQPPNAADFDHLRWLVKQGYGNKLAVIMGDGRYIQVEIPEPAQPRFTRMGIKTLEKLLYPESRGASDAEHLAKLKAVAQEEGWHITEGNWKA